MKTFTLLILMASMPLLATSSPSSGYPSAEKLLNAFIATYAKESRYLKKNVRAISNPSQISPGSQLGYAKGRIGYYSFQPKEWSELSDLEKSMVMDDPRLQAFIISNRNSTTYPSQTEGLTPEISEQMFPVNGVTTNEKSGKTLEDFYTMKEIPKTKDKDQGAIVIELPPHELIKDVKYDVFIEKVD